MSDPMITWQRLRSGNERSATMTLQDARAQQPAAVVFRCADWSVDCRAVFGRDCGRLIDISTWGHVVDTGVLATLEYAVDTLEVPLIVVLGHCDCQAIRTAMQAWNDADMPSGATRAMVEHAIGSIVRRGVRADSVEAVTAAHVVETGLGLLERSPAVARRVDAGKCGIVCAGVSPDSGRIRAYATVGALGEVGDSLLECV